MNGAAAPAADKEPESKENETKKWIKIIEQNREVILRIEEK
jgi:hypothetical protein